LIAVVDDEEMVRKAVVRLLQAAGYTARAFGSGREFLQFWPKNRPDCVVLDLAMPDLSGADVQRALNGAGAHFPVVIITAHDEPGVREDCMRRGAAAYLCKPLDERELLDALDAAVGASGHR
jgi:FixJ family two-component response regulator